jgi:hypothetical protein
MIRIPYSEEDSKNFFYYNIIIVYQGNNMTMKKFTFLEVIIYLKKTVGNIVYGFDGGTVNVELFKETRDFPIAYKEIQCSSIFQGKVNSPKRNLIIFIERHSFLYEIEEDF